MKKISYKDILKIVSIDSDENMEKYQGQEKGKRRNLWVVVTFVNFL